MPIPISIHLCIYISLSLTFSLSFHPPLRSYSILILIILNKYIISFYYLSLSLSLSLPLPSPGEFYITVSKVNIHNINYRSVVLQFTLSTHPSVILYSHKRGEWVVRLNIYPPLRGRTAHSSPSSSSYSTGKPSSKQTRTRYK